MPSPSLRDFFAAPRITQQELAVDAANNMGDLRRGYEAGRIGTDRNAALADLASARADGDEARAAELEAQAAALRQRQGIYAPKVGRVEDIDGVGSAIDWAQGQVGQGAASMQDPIAAAAAATAAGTVLSAIPTAPTRLIGGGLRTVGAFAAPAAINQRQLKGEFYGNAMEDPEVMRSTSPQELNRTANLVGLGNAALDSVVPGIIGRGLGGAGLRAGLSSVGPGAKTVGGMLMEGTTELGQGEVNRQVLGRYNPNRDTSGDMSDRLNEFAGGAIGSGPMTAAGSFADAGYRRVGNTAGVVAEKAGQVVDMAKPYAAAGLEKATDLAGKVRGKVVDLATGEDGTASVGNLKDNLKAASQDLKSKWQATQEERDLILGNPPEHIANSDNPLEQDQWMVENYPARRDAVIDRLGKMVESGDEQAGALYDALAGAQDQNGQVAAVDAAADYIIGQSELGQLEKQATRFGEAATKGGKAVGKAAVWAALKAGSAAKTFGSAVWDGMQEGSKKNAQWTDGDVSAEFEQRRAMRDDAIKNAVRMSEYLYTAAKSQGGKTASGPIAGLLKDMGYEIAELADLSSPAALNARPDLRRNLNSSAYSLGVNRIVNSLRVAYGPQTEQVIDNLRQMAAPSQAGVFDAMAQELDTQRNDKNGAHTAQVRAEAAKFMLGSLDADTETKLLKEGINLRAPESQRQMLGMVEAVSLGRATPQARKALEGLVGRDTLNRMLAAVAPATEQDAEQDTLVNDGETAGEELVLDDNGEIIDNTSSVYDREAAEKSFAKGEGSRVYGFFGTGNRTDLSQNDPFAATTKMTRDEYRAYQRENVDRRAAGEDPLPDPRRRPRLFTEGQQLSTGDDALGKRVSDMEKYLKVDRTPERMAALMREEGNKAGADKVEALIARGDESAQAALDNAMKSFFVNRAGGWRVGAQSAWDVLKEQNAQPTRILSLFRDYLRQDGDTERAELVNQVMLDEMDQQKGDAGNLRVQVGTRKRIKAAAEQYFRERSVVVADRMSNRDPMKIDETELLQMHEAGQKVVDLARKDGGNKLIAAANILTFKSDLTKSGLLHIKVSDLVREVQKRQNESTANDFEDNGGSFSNASKNQKYLDMVLEGVGMVMDSGRATGWPYKINEKNQREFFGDGPNGVPPSLMLATSTNEQFMFGKEQRAKNATGKSITDPESTDYQERVAKDQNRGFFVPDDSVPSDKPTVRMRIGGEGWFNRNEFTEAGRDALDNDPKKDKALNRTPLDTQRKPKGGRSMTGAPDEYADQRARSIAQGYDAKAIANPTEAKATAIGRAGERAAPIVAALKNSFDDGLAMVERRLRTAEAPEYSGEKNVALGGAHYVAPLAHALSADVIAGLDMTPAEAKQIQALRVRVAKVLLDGKFKQNERVALTRALAPAEAAGRITAQNVNKYLAKVVGTDTAPASGNLNVSDAYLASENFEDVTTAAQAENLLRAAQTRFAELKAMDDLTAVQKKAYAVLDGWFGRSSTADLGSFFQDGRTDADVRKMLAPAKEAGAPVGKSQSAPSGAVDWSNSGRMRNAQGAGQLAGTHSPAFRRWFGSSEVVDPDGEPTVMYHGTQTDFDEFRPSRRAGGLIFVTADPKIADGYAVEGGGYTTMGNAEDRVLVEQFLREVPDPTPDDFKYYDLPTDVNSVESLYAWIDAQGEGANVMPLYVKAESIFGSREAPIPWRNAEKMGAAGLKAAGYDAVWVTEQGGVALAVVDPKQLKSAIGNNGEFSPSAADIRRNAQDGRTAGSAQKSTQAERDAAVAEIRRTLGDKVKVEFADITGYSGEFIDADNLIRISTTPAAGTLQTAYHEGLHAFFKQFVRSNPLAMDVVKALAEHKPTLDRVHALLEGYPEAQAALANGEERLAYMYQFWRADLLDLPYGKPRTLFQKVLKAFRRIFGRVSDLERSTELLRALASGQLAGDPSVAGKVIANALNQGTWTRNQVRKMDGLVQAVAAAVLPANDVLARSDSTTAKILAKTLWTNPGDESDGMASEGYLNARARMAARYTNEFSRFISDLSTRDLKTMTEALQREDDNLDAIAHAPTRKAAKDVRALIQRFRQYMVGGKGLPLGDRGPAYFPRVWDPAALMEKQGEFLNLMTTKYADMLYGDTPMEKGESAMRLFTTLLNDNMVDDHLLPQRDDGVMLPFFSQSLKRKIDWMDAADAAKFQSKDAIKTLTTYFHSGARAAEYYARFGKDGEKLSKAFDNIELELMQSARKRERRGEFKSPEARDKWVARQMRDVRRSVDAMEGSIGKGGNMALRKFGSAMTVYQNVRLLPLAIFSQVVDPLGMLARGATMKQAYESFLRGMKEVGQSWGDMFREEPKERKSDKWEKLAMAVGSVDAAMFSHHVSEEYSSSYMSPTAKKINDIFFRANGMEAWNRGMRVGATKAAVEFLLHHKGLPNEHSKRWLRELNLTPADILTDSDGDLLTDWRSVKAQTGWDEAKAKAHTDRMHYAINRWVQGAVLTPNAAQRPAWSSDPSYSMFFHLKQFSYSFHQTILKRAVKELNYGNLAPLASFAWYIPAMIAADVTKGLALNGGELPNHLKGMDLGDWVMHGIDRSGMLGVGSIGVDAAGDVSSLAGPAVEQIIDGFRADMGATTLNALPASPIAKALVN